MGNESAEKGNEAISLSPEISLQLPVNIPANQVGQARARLSKERVEELLGKGGMTYQLIPVCQKIGEPIVLESLPRTIERVGKAMEHRCFFKLSDPL